LRALVIGHFSTVGDIESLELVQRILDDRGIAYDVAPYKPKLVRAIRGSIAAASADPANYTHLIAVCGPLWPDFLDGHGVALDRYRHCVRIGVNLTMVLPLDQWNPFHVLIERDSTRGARPDATFLIETGEVPVAGLCTIARQREYGDRQRHSEAIALFGELVERRGLATIGIDTRWPRKRNSGGLGTPAEVMSVIRRTDVLLTNRLHGLVYALKAGVPVIALDSVRGGDKLTAQARVLGWPAIATVEQASLDWLEEQMDWCLSSAGRAAAQAVADRARALLDDLPQQLRAALDAPFEDRPLPAAPSATSQGMIGRLINKLRR
jgi:hypothetical protein